MSTYVSDLYDEAMITPEIIYGKKKELCHTCIITFSSEILEYAITKYKNEVIGAIASCSGNKPIYGLDFDSKIVGLYKSEVGSCMASNMIIDANWLTGATNFVMFGSAGVVNQEATQGKVVVPNEAYRDEGMSFHYAAQSDYITVKNSSIVAKIFDEIDIPYVVGRTWTTDAMYRETRNKTERLRADGCLVVEMEAAGVQAVCDFHGFELYNFLFTGDVLDLPEWSYADLRGANHRSNNFEIAAEVAKRL